jgi:type VI secretion system ImpH/TssG family protein
METMASNGRGTADPVELQLYSAGAGFDFYQAVRLLEWLHDDEDVLGECTQPERESVRFRSAVGFDFPPTDVAAIDFGPHLFALPAGRAERLDAGEVAGEWRNDFGRYDIPFVPEQAYARVLRRGQLWKLVDRASRRPYLVLRRDDTLYVYDGQAAMLVNFMGLAGVHGPLPSPVAMQLIERSRAGDEILRDFLDIFNHRLVSLMYRVRKLHRRGMAHAAPGSERDRFAQYLYALIGLGEQRLRGRLSIPDRALLRYAGLLAQYPRSAAGLEALLGDYFEIPVQVVQLQGQWLPLPHDEYTRLGRSGGNQALGQSFTLGCRVYDPQGAFEIRLGPLDLAAYEDFQPGGASMRALVELAQFYVRKEYSFEVRLLLKGAQVPQRGSRNA